MKLRNIIVSAGIATFVAGCHKPVKEPQVPKPTPIVYKTQSKLHYKAHSTGYDVRLEQNFFDIATYRFNNNKACLSLNAPDKDWVEICATDNKVVSLVNYDMNTECDFTKHECSSSLEPAKRLFNKWKKKLNIEHYHKRWLNEKNKPLKDWL
ncbi:hypothetical protein D6777_03365 [Candidatus Woesearchaeota archaeon]|nr:MAG: hypothetical protein D6777_03365 [Candidatus Woesearchaeota archaeon]